MAKTDDELDLTQLGLVEFLQAAEGPACIVRVGHGQRNGGHGGHGGDDEELGVVWQNDKLDSTDTYESAIHAVRTARADLNHSSKGQLAPSYQSIEVGQGARIRWRCVPLRAGSYWALTGVEDDAGPSEPHHTKPPGLKPTGSSSTVVLQDVPTYDPKVADVFIGDVSAQLSWLTVTGRTPESQAFIELFKSVEWGKGKLGNPNGWSTSLVTMVNVCLSAPFPVLLSWGDDKVLLYNEHYSKVIGTRHPSILGMPYDEAWPEVWDALGPVVESAYAGNIVHVDDQEMFLKRKDILEETFFTWSMIPLRGVSGTVEGLFIPNFDRSNAVISNRRLAGLHEISRHIATGTSPELVMEAALQGLAKNSRDIGFVLLYTTERDGVNDFGKEASITFSGARTAGTDSGSVSYGDHLSADDTGNEESEVTLALAGVIGAIDLEGPSDHLPRTLTSHRSYPAADCDQTQLADLIKLAHIRDELVLLSGDEMDVFKGSLRPNVFGDIPQQAAVIPIKASGEDRCHGMLVVGLSTRLYFNESYSNYMGLVRTLLANGRAAAELHLEEKSRAEYFAAINRQKARELEAALDRKTQELKEAELKFTSAFDISPAGIWIGSPDGKVEFANQVYRQWSGLEGAGSLDKWMDRVHPDDKIKVHEQFMQCLKARAQAEFRFLTGGTTKDGEPEVIWIEGTAQPAYGPGLNPETGKREVLFVTGALIDVTSRKASEEFQARRADDNLAMRRQLEDFVDYASHEHRTPLFGMGMANQSLIDRLRALQEMLSIEQQAEIEDALQEANIVTLCISHMQRLADDILLLSKLDRDMLVMTPAPCRPIQIARDVADMIVAPEHDIEYALDVTSKYHDLVDWVSVDPQRVAQVIINLVNNAVKFTRKRPRRRITIRLDASKSKPPVGVGEFLNEDGDTATPKALLNESKVVIICSVQDTGIGIEPDEAKKLFRRFQQTVKTSATYGGSGLGLFLCKRITQKLGGDITLQTEHGKGSTFTFYVEAERCDAPPVDSKVPLVPLVNKASREEHAVPVNLRTEVVKPLVEQTHGSLDRVTSDMLGTAKPGDATKGVAEKHTLRILLAEDNLINQKLLQRQLIKAGFDVDVANNGLEALEYVNTTTVSSGESGVALHCILMDIEMPKMGGIECMGEIRKIEAGQSEQRRIPIIAVTANARTEQIQQMLDSGFDDAIAKPFSIKALTTKINGLAHTYRTTHDM